MTAKKIISLFLLPLILVLYTPLASFALCPGSGKKHIQAEGCCAKAPSQGKVDISRKCCCSLSGAHGTAGRDASAASVVESHKTQQSGAQTFAVEENLCLADDGYYALLSPPTVCFSIAGRALHDRICSYLF